MGLDIFESIEGVEGYGDSLFSRMIKAGHRTYFVDVKTTRQQDYFLSLTELRKKLHQTELSTSAIRYLSIRRISISWVRL